MSNSESTLSTISASSSASDKSTAANAVTSEVALIVNSVNAATASVKALAPSKLARRQAAGLQAALTTLLTEINDIAETLVADLGLSKSPALSLWWCSRCKARLTYKNNSHNAQHSQPVGRLSE